MPRLALALVALSFFVLFFVRSVIQWRRTGSTGLKGFHGPVGSPPWIAGMAVSAGFVLAPVVPIAMLLDWPGGAALFESARVHAIGACLMLVGTAGALAAQLSMGDAWRVGVDDAEATRLVRSGLFAWVRNPIYSFMGMSLVGLLLLAPNAVAIAAVAITALGVELQVRAVEEPHLARLHGADYADYVARVGRFVPGLGLRRTS